ncbi:MAG: Tar ligand binding domain-containing protein, partial [Telluria sp.]
MFKNITIKTRLVFVLAFLGLQLVIGAVIGLVSLGMSNSSMQSIYEDRLVPLAQLDTVIRLLEQNQLNIAAALTAEPQEAERLLKEVDSNVLTVTQTWNAYMATRLTETEKVLAAKFVAARQASIAGGIAPAMKALRAGDLEAARTLLHGPVKQLFAPVREGVNQLIELQREVAEQDYTKARDTYELVFALCTAGVIFGLILAATIGTLLVRAIVRPLDRAVHFAEAVSAGDLSQRIEAGSRDEMGRLMNALQGMNDGLVRIVGQVRSGAESIASASGQIAAGNLDLSSRTEEQASSLEETASSMEELTSTVKQNADNARQANGLAQSASEVAVKGGAVVADVVTTMESINES